MIRLVQMIWEKLKKKNITSWSFRNATGQCHAEYFFKKTLVIRQELIDDCNYYYIIEGKYALHIEGAFEKIVTGMKKQSTENLEHEQKSFKNQTQLNMCALENMETSNRVVIYANQFLNNSKILFYLDLLLFCVVSARRYVLMCKSKYYFSLAFFL